MKFGPIRLLAGAPSGAFSLNLLFATAFLLCGADALVGAAPRDMGGPHWRAFFFSVETFATIGYGEISPVGLAPHMVMVVESLVALMSQALITGFLFARFARPRAAIRRMESRYPDRAPDSLA